MQSTTTITGRIVRDPKIRTTTGGKQVADVTIAVEDYRLPGEVRYIDVPQWEDAAGRATDYLPKGRWVTAEGHLDARAYTDKNDQLRVGWTLRHAQIEYGPSPNTPTEDRQPVAAGADDDIQF